MFKNVFSSIGAIIVLTSCVSNSGSIKEFDKQEYLKLRNATAVECTSPDSYLKLARYHYDIGNKIQAFYIAENTRKMCSDALFDAAFAKIKLGEVISFDSEQKYNNYCKANPDSFAAFWSNYMKKVDKNLSSEESLSDLINSAKDKFSEDFYFKSLAARYYLKSKDDPKRALPLYIDVYFHNPHYYDGEYAESRIKYIISDIESDQWLYHLGSGVSLVEYVAKEKNPRVLENIINEAERSWNPSMIPALMKMLENDDKIIQSRSLYTLLAHPKDLAPYKAEIRALIEGEDFVLRAIGSFLVAKVFDHTEYGILKDNLDSGVELIQVDTIQALTMMGEKGHEFLKKNPPAKGSELVMKYWKK